MPSPKTAKILRTHTKRRALERFGITLNKHDINGLVKLIQAGQAEFYDRQSNNVTRWIVTIHGKKVGIVYDKLRKCIRTVLPVEYLSQEPPAR
jgi:hypothetical protein